MPPVRRSTRAQPIPSESRTLRARRHVQPEPPKPRPRKPPKSYLQRPSPETNPNINVSLFSLPRELFDEIVSWLSPSAEACMSLTCKEALHRLGTSSWTQLRWIDKTQYDEFDTALFELLHRDLPDFELCPRCEILHPPLKPPTQHRTAKFTKLCLGQEASMDYWPQTPEGGYSIVYPHILDAYEARPADVSDDPAIDLFHGDFNIQMGAINFQLTSSGRWIDRNLVLRQDFRLSKPNGPLQAADITILPLRLCAHLTPSTAPPTEEVGYRSAKGEANGGFMTHAIASAFPEPSRRGIPGPKSFRNPTPAERTQMNMGSGDPEYIWRCRSCPTKFRVQYRGENGGELSITAWHCFHRERYKFQRYWRAFVRREGSNLGKSKRNSEFYVPSRGVPDFRVE